VPTLFQNLVKKFLVCRECGIKEKQLSSRIYNYFVCKCTVEICSVILEISVANGKIVWKCTAEIFSVILEMHHIPYQT
jgi:hypothetical protein